MTFLFVGPVWFLTSRTCPTVQELCAAVLRGYHQDSPGEPLSPFVYAFSDRDLAERFLEKSGRVAGGHSAVTLDSQAQFIELLEELYAHGDRRLGVDSESTHINF